MVTVWYGPQEEGQWEGERSSGTDCYRHDRPRFKYLLLIFDRGTLFDAALGSFLNNLRVYRVKRM